MQAQGIALWRWLCWRRREIWIGVTLVVAVAVLMFVGPWLLLLAAVEWKTSRRRRARLLGLVLTVLLVRAVVRLWQEFWDVPHGRWHPCMQCGHPIEAPSRAWYCSPSCRRYAQLERRAAGGDERATNRLERLRSTRYDPELAEVPY